MSLTSYNEPCHSSHLSLTLNMSFINTFILHANTVNCVGLQEYRQSQDKMILFSEVIILICCKILKMRIVVLLSPCDYNSWFMFCLYTSSPFLFICYPLYVFCSQFITKTIISGNWTLEKLQSHGHLISALITGCAVGFKEECCKFQKHHKCPINYQIHDIFNKQETKEIQ